MVRNSMDTGGILNLPFSITDPLLHTHTDTDKGPPSSLNGSRNNCDRYETVITK